jgi:Zn finger protein HypA/HybF involved in hydrogenase expression
MDNDYVILTIINPNAAACTDGNLSTLTDGDTSLSTFFPGPPYFFVCHKCGHRFIRRIRLGLICPKCKSLSVGKDTVLK